MKNNDSSNLQSNPPLVIEDVTPPMMQIETKPDVLSTNPAVSESTSSSAPVNDVVMQNNVMPAIVTSSPKKKFGGGKVIATILGLFLLVGGVGAGVYLTSQNQNIAEKADDSCPYNSTQGVAVCQSAPTLAADELQDCYNGRCLVKKGCSNGDFSTCSIVVGEYRLAGTGNTKCEDPTTYYACAGAEQCTCCPNGTTISTNGTYEVITDRIDDPNNKVPFQPCGYWSRPLEVIVIDPDYVPGNDWITDKVKAICPKLECGTTTEITASCQNVKAYSTNNWTLLTPTALSSLKAGDSVNFCVTGVATGGSFNKAKFTINRAVQAETTTVRPGSTDFCQLYVIPTATTTFNVSAQINHVTLGWK